MQNKKRIPVSDNVAYTHWEMPDLTGVKRRIAQRLNELKKEEGQQEKQQEQESLLVKPVAPTPEELIAQAEQASQEGYAAGFAEGLLAGQEEGRTLGYQEGEKTGEETGFQAGYQRGLDQAEQEVDQQLARLQSLIEQLQGPVVALDQDVENALLSLVDLVCRAILRREVKLERGFLTEVLQEAVAALPVGHQRLRIFLNPEDLNLAEAACENLLEDYRLVGDSEVTLGGARVETLQSLVDSTLESRYKKIIDKLLGSAYQPAAKGFAPLSSDVLDTPDAPSLDQAAFSKPSSTPSSSAASPELEPQSRAEPQTEALPNEAVPPVDKLLAEEAVLPEPQVEALPTEAMLPVDELLAEDPLTKELLAEELLADAKAEVENKVVPEVAAEPITQVSLQRGTTPRHELPKSTDAQSTDAQPESFESNDFNFNDAEDDLVDLTDLNELINSPADTGVEAPELAEAPVEDEPIDLFAKLEPDSLNDVEAGAAIEQDDDFLPEFDLDEAEADFELLFSEDASESSAILEDAAIEDELMEAATVEAAVAQEKNWSPESIHDDRYLEEGALEKAWLDAAEESADNKPLDVIEDQDIPHG